MDANWLTTTAERVLAAVEERRSTWQSWHVRAEAQRQVRAAQVPTDKVDPLVELLVAEVLQTRSVSLARTDDNIAEPTVLRRSGGSSVYTVAGSELFTSTRILAAEQRLVTAAGRTNGWVLDAATVELALLESAANGNALDVGQAALVRSMCTSGGRLQLAIAPAGAGKTTAMRTLASAWTDSGGHVIGLAPSAAAAAQLRDATGAQAKTLAKLTWSIDHAELPDWVDGIGRSTLVIIDEAGMADTVSLDTAVQFIIGRGGSVRLVGDDQQLAAIGAGGVLRDIQASHGAVRLSELHRFADPAEAAATLAVRDGRPEALGLYLDRQRVHVGDPTTSIDAVFNAWQTDRSHGLDAVMLAPTRELVSRLNQRAQDHRLADTIPRRQVELADGNHAGVGDLIITRRNDRRLRTTATDWVKNGDRFQLADQIRLNAAGEAPAWAAQLNAPMPAELIADVQVWRAATQVDPIDLRPTGPPQNDNAARIFQQRLDQQLAAADAHADLPWRQLLAREAPRATADPFLPELAKKLNNLTRAGFDATLLVRSAAAAGPLPDDHPAAALWWRILDQLPGAPDQARGMPSAGPPTRQRTTTSLDRQPPRPRSVPPPAFGPSR
ncbi:MAG TPA: AAA family ATPase [Propionibacteriaceae bacterium]